MGQQIKAVSSRDSQSCNVTTEYKGNSHLLGPMGKAEAQPSPGTLRIRPTGRQYPLRGKLEKTGANRGVSQGLMRRQWLNQCSKMRYWPQKPPLFMPREKLSLLWPVIIWLWKVMHRYAAGSCWNPHSTLGVSMKQERKRYPDYIATDGASAGPPPSAGIRVSDIWA
jgi:hypothetical protein